MSGKRPNLSIERIPERAQVETAAFQRRTPEISAGDRPRKSEQRIDNAIFAAGHALQLCLERGQRTAESDEHQPGARRVAPPGVACPYPSRAVARKEP